MPGLAGWRDLGHFPAPLLMEMIFGEKVHKLYKARDGFKFVQLYRKIRMKNVM